METKTLIDEDHDAKNVIYPFLIGDEIRRYIAPKPTRFIIYATRGFDLDAYPSIRDHLTTYRRALSARATVGTHPWFELQQPQPRYAEMFAGNKIVWPEIARESRFTLVPGGVFINNKCFFANTGSLALLGVLNSTLVWELLKLMCSCLGDVNKGGRLELRHQYLSRLPLPETLQRAANQNKSVGRLNDLVQRMLDLHAHQPKARTEHERMALARQIEHTDAEIDRLVYELYGLTEEEIALVESATK